MQNVKSLLCVRKSQQQANIEITMTNMENDGPKLLQVCTSLYLGPLSFHYISLEDMNKLLYNVSCWVKNDVNVLIIIYTSC